MKIKNLILSTIAVVVALAASICVSQAQTTLLVRFALTNTDGLTTLQSDTSSGGANLTLNMLNDVGAAANFEGVPGSGVSGLGVALDFSTNSDFSGGDGINMEGGSSLGGANFNGPVADITNSTALNFGVISNYTATIWMKANSLMNNTAAHGPRIFVIGPHGTTDKAAGNLGLYWQAANEVAISAGGTEVNYPATNGLAGANIPTNAWIFLGMTVSNGTNATLYAGTDGTSSKLATAVAVATGVLTAANGTLSLTNPLGSVLLIGNTATGTRDFDGWLDDFRFYSGVATSNNVEDIRWSAVIPTGLSAASGAGANLTWNALGGAGSYNVFSSGTSGGPYSLVASGVTSNSYVDTTAVNGNTYYYVISAVDANGGQTTTANSAEASVTVTAPPAVPTGFTATPASTQVTLNWNASVGSPAAASYNVARSSNNGGAGSGGETIFATNVTTTSYIDMGLTNGVTYYYEVSAVSALGSTSPYTTEASATPVGPPLAPAGLTNSQGSHFSVVLTWTDPNPANIQSIDTYTIQSSPDGVSWATIATGVSGLTYTDTTTVEGQTVFYQVFAVNTGGTSVASNPTSITLKLQVTLPDLAEQTVRAAANGNVVLNDSGQSTNPVPLVGFLRVKWINDGTPFTATNSPGNVNHVTPDTTSCAKTYFRWNLGSVSPNTNADLQMTWTTAVNNGNSTMILWSLNQPYPFTTGLTGSTNANGTISTNGNVTWNNAQANDTNYNGTTFVGTFQMLTNGSHTATQIAYLPFFVTPPGNPVTVTIPAPWGNLIHNNELVFCLGGTNDPAGAPTSQGANGYRINNQSTSLVYDQIVGSHPPTISLINNMTLTASTSGSSSFTITDPDDTVGTFAGLQATATVLADTTQGASAGITGTGANEQVNVTAGGTPGTITVEVTFTDGSGDPAQRTFYVTVVPQIIPPTISTPPNTNTVGGTPLVIPFTVGDSSAPLNTLTVSAGVTNIGKVLVSAVANGSGANWTVTVTPVANTNGIGIVSLTVTDTNGNTTATSFAVLVRSSAQTVFSDVFDYADGSLLLNSDGVWSQIGPGGPVLNVSGGILDLAATANGEVGFANLLGAPYAQGSHALIYMTFTANWSSFIADSWLSLAPFGGTSATHIADVGNVPDAAGDGNFNATIANNGANAVSTNSQTLSTGVTYNVAVRYDVDTAQATLWIDATNEADPNGTPVTATDPLASGSVSSVILSQNSGAASAAVALDDLTVSVITPPHVTAVSVAGGSVQITFTASAGDSTGNFGVTSTTNLTVPFSAASPVITSLGGGVFQATLPTSGNQSFYQVYRAPFSFTY